MWELDRVENHKQSKRVKKFWVSFKNERVVKKIGSKNCV